MTIRAGSSDRVEIATAADIADMATQTDLDAYQPLLVTQEVTETEEAAIDAPAILAILETLGLVEIVPDPEP